MENNKHNPQETETISSEAIADAAAHPKPAAAASNKKKRMMIGGGAVIVLAIGLLAFTWTSDTPTPNNEPASENVAESNAEPAEENEASADEEESVVIDSAIADPDATADLAPEPISLTEYDTPSNVPEYLFASTQTDGRFSLGYIQAASTASAPSGGFLSPGVAHAQSADYHSVAFYNVSGSSDNSDVYMFNLNTKESTLLTQNSASSPIFSSAVQQLAFQRDCNVYLMDITTLEETMVLAGESAETGTCYSPQSWSPDGTKLAIHGQYVEDGPEWGLVGFNDLYIYDFSANTNTKVRTINDYNNSSEMLWEDSGTILAYYHQFAQFADIVDEGFVRIDLASGDITDVNVNMEIALSTVRTVGDTTYAIQRGGDAPSIVTTKDLNFLEFTELPNSTGMNSMLLETNDSGTAVVSIFGGKGEAGDQDTHSIHELSVDGASITELAAPKGFGVSLLGWGADFDELVFISILSGKIEIHLLTVSTQEQSVLVPDLPLVQ